MEIMSENINISQTVAKGKADTVCDGNIIVPDKKPDILKVVQVDSKACITDKVVRDNKISLSGKVCLTILYIPDSDSQNIASINSSFDFSETVNVSGVEEGMNIIASADVTRVDFNIINSRKLHIKNVLCLTYEVIEIKNVDVATGVEDDNIEVKTESVKMKNVYDICDHEFVMNEDISLLAGQNDVSDILKTDVEITDTEYKTISGRIILKGIVNVCVLYLADNGEIEHTENEMPFTEIVESESALDNMDCDVEYSVIDSSCEAGENSDGDMRDIKLSVDIMAGVKASRNEEINVISDCYVPGKNTEIKSEDIAIEENVLSVEEQNTIRDIVDFPDGVPRVKSVYNVVMTPVVSKTDIVGGRLICEGKIDAYILYLSENSENPVYSLHHEMPYTVAIDVNVSGDDLVINPRVEIKHSGYTLNAAGEIELRCILNISADIVRNNEISLIDDITDTDMENNGANIVIYFTKKGDSVWDIAKRYSVPVDNILRYNNIDNQDKLRAGERIFVSAR